MIDKTLVFRYNIERKGIKPMKNLDTTVINPTSKLKTLGTIKWCNDSKGFGFIQSESIASDIFVHYTAMPSKDFKDIKDGQRVAFDLITGPKGAQAFNVEVRS